MQYYQTVLGIKFVQVKMKLRINNCKTPKLVAFALNKDGTEHTRMHLFFANNKERGS